MKAWAIKRPDGSFYPMFYDNPYDPKQSLMWHPAGSVVVEVEITEAEK